MAVAIPEAAEAVTSGTAAVEGAGARAAARPKTIRAERTGATYESRTEAPPRRGQKRRAQATIAPQLPKRKGGKGTPRQYQPVILAEFMVAVLVTAVAPVAQGGDRTAQAKGGPSPYSSDTLKQLVAIGAAYFLLALLSGSRKYGRLTAWFGGLILLAVGLNSFVTGGLMAIFGIFGPSPQVTTPDQLGQELGQMAQATEAGAALLPGAYPTPSGQPSAAQQVVAGQDSQTNLTFTQPGVVTTTEATAGVTGTIGTGTGIARSGGGGVVRSPQPGVG